jgi:hypothetical protein
MVLIELVVEAVMITGLARELKNAPAERTLVLSAECGGLEDDCHSCHEPHHYGNVIAMAAECSSSSQCLATALTPEARSSSDA